MRIKAKADAMTGRAGPEIQKTLEQPARSKEVHGEDRQEQPVSCASRNIGGITGNVDGELINFKTLNWL